MGRKKKNHPSTPSPSKTSNSKMDAAGTNALHDETFKDAVNLRLVRNAKSSFSKPSNMDNRTPLLFLAEEDAYQMDVIKDDEILVLSTNNQKSTIVASAICSARIAPKGGGTPRKAGSTSRVSMGDCRVTPSLTVDRLCGTDALLESLIESDQVGTPNSSTPSSSSTTPTPSSSKSKFSFAKGGGGDTTLSSPPTLAQHPSTPRTLQISFSRMWAIPLRSSLGAQLSKVLCQKAAQIRIIPRSLSEFLNRKTLNESKRILERLVLAAVVGRHVVCEGDILQSSFQGRVIEWNIDSIKGNNHVDLGKRETTTSCSIMDDFDAMSLHDDPNLNSDQQGILDALEESGLDDSSNRLILYKISHDTSIEIILSSSEGCGSDSVKDSSAAVTLFKKEPQRRTFVAGLDTTIEHIKSLLLPPLLHPEMYTKGALKPPRGVLVHGPGGVGKTILAKQIAADLQQTMGFQTQTVNCSTLQSHTAIVGEAERMLTRLFRSAKQQPNNCSDGTRNGTLLILDDVHLICPKRGGSNPGADRLSATLLALLDGIGSSPSTVANSGGEATLPQRNVVILAITTNPSLLDTALRRPGRLDAEVEVPIPDEVTRGAILAFQMDRVGESRGIRTPSLSDKDIVKLARLAKGFNGADCMLAIKEALRAAIGRAAPQDEKKDNGSNNVNKIAIELTIQDLQSAIQHTKPSTIQSVTVEIPEVHWTSIGGMDSVKAMLKEAIELPITHAHLFRALHISPPRGVLLYGPPGCSKTLMARALATEGHMNFLAVKGPELLSKWLGESERALASLFRRARMASPCIIFFDELDAIATKRGSSGGNSGGERLLSQLLTELDGVVNTGSNNSSSDNQSSNKRVIVVGATNRPDLLDSALMRPGRIDRMIYVGLPDQKSRESILEIGLKGKTCSNDIDISELASDGITGGFSGAEMISICREAALFAIEEDDENSSENVSSLSGSPITICMQNLLHAIEGTKRQITTEMLDFYGSFQNKAPAS